MKTLSVAEIPMSARENYILSGYRPLGHSFFYCLRSFFVLHNESLNVWTHVVPAMYYVTLLVTEMHLNGWRVDIARVPVLGLMFGVTCILVASTVAHLFCCLSVRWKKTLFVLDYAAIVVYAVMAASICTVYIPSTMFFLQSKLLYVLLTIPAILVGGMVCCWTMLRGPEVETAAFVRVLAFGVPYVYGNIPPLLFLLSSDLETLGGSYAIKTQFLRCIVLAAIAGFFKASCVPERWFPGRFDLFGHSHQLFHVFIFFSFHDQYHFADKLSRLNIERSELFIKQVMGSGVIAILIFVLLIVYCIRSSHSTARAEKSFNRKQK